jgi:DNA primase large subunit
MSETLTCSTISSDSGNTVLGELEACSFRNRSPAETATHMKPLLDKYLPLDTNSSASSNLFAQRQKDHYSHFILRLAFSSTEDLRRRFTRVETILFKLRFNNDDLSERSTFISGLDFDWWEAVSDEERQEYAAELAATAGPRRSPEDDSWFKVDWDRVPDLIEGRRVFLKQGKAYVPGREQSSMVVAEFSSRLEKQLQVSRRKCVSRE